MLDCINLREVFGDRYHVTFEESYAADLGKGVRRGDPWLMIIPCNGRRGHIFPWGGTRLAASVDRPGVAKQVARLDCCQVVQDGNDGLTVVFNASDMEEVAKILRPKRRRRLSAEHRARAIARLDNWQRRSRQADRAALRRDRAADHVPVDVALDSRSGCEVEVTALS